MEGAIAIVTAVLVLSHPDKPTSVTVQYLGVATYEECRDNLEDSSEGRFRPGERAYGGYTVVSDEVNCTNIMDAEAELPNILSAIAR
jgi:hypothetical protein